MIDNKVCAAGFELGCKREYLNRKSCVSRGTCLVQACQAHCVPAVKEEDITALELGVG